MDMQSLLAAGKELGLEKDELRLFIKAEQDAAREERAAVRAAEAESAAHAAVREAESAAAVREAESAAAVREAESAAAVREAESAAAVREAESAAAVREHERHMLQLQVEADRLRVQEANTTRERLDSTKTFRSPGRSPKLPPFNDAKDDMDAYLQRFERYAENEDWDTDCLGVYLGSLLTGQALEEYSRLPAADARNYAILKKALLTRYQLTQEDYRRKFLAGSQSARETASQFLVRLEHLFDHWVRLSDIEHTYEGLRELTVMEHYLHACPRELALFIRERSPIGLKQLVELADVYTAARASVAPPPRVSPAPRSPMLRPPTRFEPPQHTLDARPPYRSAGRGGGNRRCFLCNMPDHMAASCPTGRPRPYGDRPPRPRFDGPPGPVSGNAAMSIPADHECSFHAGQAYLQCGCTLPIIGSVCCHQVERLPLMKGRVEETDVQVLRDTGCNGVIVKYDLVSPQHFTGSRQRIILMDRSVIEVPVAKIRIDTPVFCGEVYALCVQNPVCDLIIGNIPGVHPNILGATTTDELPTTTSIEAPPPSDEPTTCAVQTRGQHERADRPTKPLKTSDGCRSLEMTPAEFQAAQKADNELSRYFEIARDETVDKETDRKWFEVSDGVLFRFFRHPQGGVVLKQAIVPNRLRTEVLKLGHEGVLAGHLGTKRTADRILAHFFWPGIFGDIKRFCQSCDICQRTVNKGSVKKAPVQEVPLVHLPFQKVAIDLIGPLSPASNRNHRWVLTLVDYATRYPEAVALVKIDTETVAEALLGIFARVGFPQEILSDNGTQFVSHVMQEVARLISVKQLFSSPYHPMANGLCERFNGTLKKMLLRLCSEQPREWDRYLEPLLFAYREVPQESTGFSPFELLYGRTVRGPMAILRELWTKEGTPSEVTTTYQYVFDLRNRIEDTCRIVQENLSSAQQTYKRHFDKKAKLRVLVEGEKVLVMLPTDNNKLLLRWKGPYTIKGKVGITDYRIQVGNQLRLFHVNMLRKYTEREPIECAMAAVIDIVDCPELVIEAEPSADGETIQDIDVSREIEEPHANALRQLLSEYSDIFSDMPGLTDIAEHRITLNTEKPIRRKPYPVPYAKVGDIETEVRKMMALGVIEPSQSPYCSPLMLVKKVDGTFRPVIDFRQINRVTVFDAEPMPNPEVIFAKLAHDKVFSTFDFCKGYWQIPMVATDKEKTAFSSSLGLFQFRRMPFGLVNAGATYGRMMRRVLDGLPDVDNYVDDVIVHSPTWKSHLGTLRALFARVRQASLTVKPSKCHVGYLQVDFVGHQVGSGLMLTQSDKVDKVKNAEVPRTKTQVRSFLGLAGYYRKFIPHYASLTTPLSDLTKKGAPASVQWNDELEASFTELKSLMCSAPVLRLPDFQKEFVLRTDASDTGLGAVLLQKHDDQLFPVAYASKKLSGAPKSYATVEKECLAIIWGIEKFVSYLYGRAFVLQTYHQPLKYLASAKLTNPRLLRWALKLQPFRFRVESIRGSDNVGADYLSRL